MHIDVLSLTSHVTARFQNAMLRCATHAERTEKMEDNEVEMIRYIRRLSRRHWTPTAEALRAYYYNPHYATWKPVIEAYMRLGHALCIGDQILDVICFGGEKRSTWYGPSRSTLHLCHWESCLSSEWKPGHRLKACQGCRKVYYCGSDCQSR